MMRLSERHQLGRSILCASLAIEDWCYQNSPDASCAHMPRPLTCSVVRVYPALDGTKHVVLQGTQGWSWGKGAGGGGGHFSLYVTPYIFWWGLPPLCTIKLNMFYLLYSCNVYFLFIFSSLLKPAPPISLRKTCSIYVIHIKWQVTP